MNTCEIFCAACICGVWLAFTTPRQTIPFTNPSVSGIRVHQLRYELIVRHVVASARVQPFVICLRPPSM